MGPHLLRSWVVYIYIFLSCGFYGIAWCHDQDQQLLCCCSVAKSCLTLCNSMDCDVPSPLSSTISQCVCVCVCVCVHALSVIQSVGIYSVMSIELGVPSNHLILCHPLLVLPSIFPSIRVFPMSWLFTSGGQSIGASVSALPMSIQG